MSTYQNAALLVIDMQRGFLEPSSPLFIDGAPASVPACAAVIAACREQGIPVFFVTRAYAADGSDVEKARRAAWEAGGKPLSPLCAPELSTDMPEEFGFCEKDYLLWKPRFSAFFQTPLDLMLRRRGIDREQADETLAALPDNTEKLDVFISRRLKDPNDRDSVRKISAALFRRGYSWEEIRAALRRFNSNIEED